MSWRGALHVAPVLVLLALAALFPGTTQAHAAFVSSQPAAGERLSAAPGIVVLLFTEPINVRLSRAAVTDPTGRRFEGRAIGERELQVRLETNAPGAYTVEWTTVSTVDGHTLRGSYQFGVGVTLQADAEASTTLAPQRADLLIALFRAAEYAALLLAVGMLLLRQLAGRTPPLAWLRVRPPLALAAALASGLAVVLGEALAAAPAPSADAVVQYLTTALPGAARLARLGLEGAALAAYFLVRNLAWVPLAGAMLALAAAGHAAAVRPAWWGMAVDAIHIVTAALWAGGVLALATLRPPGGWRAREGRQLLERFTPVALCAFLLTVGSGVLRGAQELAGAGDLVGSSYGQVLSAKALSVAAMVPLSLLAWRRRSVALRAEAGLAVVVVAAAALLAAYPLPPARAGEAETAAAGDAAAATTALPQAGDLTLGGDAGEVLVGLTLRPGVPGRNEVLVYVLPRDGAAAAAGLPAELAVQGRPVLLRTCGAPCRRGEAEVQGGERVEVRVAGPTGGTAAFALPPLPAPDATSVLEQAQALMRALQTLRVDEELRPAEPPIRGAYTYQAPDRMHSSLSTGTELVWVGGTRYFRPRSDGPWRVEATRLSIRAPSFIWDSEGQYIRQVVAPRLLGTASLGGADVRVIAFFVVRGRSPIWFRLWVDATGLVRRSEMRAQSHFMDHRYYDFDAPFVIEAPGA